MTEVVTTNPSVENVAESSTIPTINRLHRRENDEIVSRNAPQRRSLIDRSAYAKLHRSFDAGTGYRRSVHNLKERFESQTSQDEPEKPKQQEESATPDRPEDFTPATFGYPKATKLKSPVLRTKPVVGKRDENSNVVAKNEHSDAEEVQTVILQPSASQDSIADVVKELSYFEMDEKTKKRNGSFRKFFRLLGGKDKNKKKEEEKKQNSDNIKNESHVVNQTARPVIYHQQELHEEKVRQLEREYAQIHIERFNKLRQTFDDEKKDNYVVINSKTKPYDSTPVDKYIDTSSSSTVSDKPQSMVRDTPPRAQETNQNIRVVKPRAAALPINSERSLPKPYQNEKISPRTIERNLNKSNSKDYPDKTSVAEETKISNSKPPPSPAKLEITKLKLPPNREIYEPQPRVKSPILTKSVSTDKIIATELLKNNRSPTPPKRTVSRLSGKSTLSTPDKGDRIVTNAQVHAPRAQTPIDLRMSVSQKLSPKKEDIRKSVEEYYWKELKKLKEEEDLRLYSQMNGYYEDPSRVKRSRSLSPHRISRRSLSLPREGNSVTYMTRTQLPIPEDETINIPTRRYLYVQNFVRSNPERRSVDSVQRPIFKRGSLTKPEVYETNPYNKRVSFTSLQQPWPKRSEYNQRQSQRRLDDVDYEVDDEVFISNVEPAYSRVLQNETHYRAPPVYTNRVLQQFRSQPNPQQHPVQPQEMGVRRMSMDSLPRQDLYSTRQQVLRRPVSNVPVDDYGRPYPYSPQHNPIYSSSQSMTDSNYGQKQISVSNKYCDIYGQIHELPHPTGVMVGQLQNSPLVPARHSANFVRGSRFTASATDLGRRYDPNDFYANYENRPLPPPPPRRNRNNQISDTESGSDVSEIQRIMQKKTKNDKRGFFGK